MHDEMHGMRSSVADAGMRPRDVTLRIGNISSSPGRLLGGVMRLPSDE